MAYDLVLKAGTTSKIIQVMLRDSTTGQGKTGVAHSSVTGSYCREGATRQPITMASGTAGDAFSSGKWCEIDATNMPGAYQFHVPDAAINTGVRAVKLFLKTSGALDKEIDIGLISVDVADSVRAGLTALPNAAADAAGGLPISDAGGLDLDNRMPAAAAVTNLNTVFNTDFANNYNTTADRWKVDLTHVNGTASTSSGGYLEVDATKWGGIAVGLAVIQVDLETIMGQSITCAAPVTVGAYVGGTAAAATQTSVDDLPTNSEMQAMIDALNQSAARRTMLATSLQWEIPESGSNTFKIQLRTYDGDGALVDADSTPTLTATGQVSGSLAANLSSATNPSTGVYVWTYTLASGSTSEQVQLDASATIGGTAFTASAFPVIADFVAATFTTSDRTKIEALYNKLPSKSYLAGTNNSDGDIQIDEATGTLADSAGVTTLLARIPASMIVRSNTAQSGSTSTTIKLDASASATNNLYRGLTVLLTGGTGAGQARTITGYNGTTKIANVDRAWITTPDNTSTFALLGTNSPSLNTNLQVSTAAASATIRTGTAQSGSTSNTIKLDTGASATNSVYVGNVVSITSGTGLGQTRTIVSYNGTTKVATVDRNWTTTPDNTSVFAIVANINPTTFSDQGVAQAGASGSITLAATASATDNIYNGSIVTILSGTAAGETSEITAYNGTTKVATVSPNFGSTPDSTSAYAVIPTTSGTGATVGDVPTATQIRIEMDTNSTQLAAILDDTGTTGVVVANGSKTGYSLASTGLDSISTTAPSGVASNFREMLVQVWRRFFKKTVYDNAGNTIKTYADDGTTIVTTQTATSAAGVETQGPAT